MTKKATNLHAMLSLPFGFSQRSGKNIPGFSHIAFQQ